MFLLVDYQIQYIWRVLEATFLMLTLYKPSQATWILGLAGFRF